MRKVAGFALFGPESGEENVESLFRTTCRLVEAWKGEKGREEQDADGSRTLIMKDRRTGDLGIAHWNTDSRELLEWTLTESFDNGLFRTSVSVGRLAKQVIVYIELKAAGDPYLVGPLRIDVRAPRIVRMLIEGDNEWYVGDVLLTAQPLSFSGSEGGAELAEIIWHPQRNLPLVAMSPFEGNLLTDELPKELARDLAGVAIVATLDEAAAWSLTKLRGKEWSCYSGAIRVYWPRLAERPDPYSNPLWTRLYLLGKVANEQDAANRFRSQIRRRLLGLSAFSVQEPSEFEVIRREVTHKDAEETRARLRDAADWESLERSYAQENDELRATVANQTSELADLRAQVSNLQVALQWRATDPSELSPQTEAPPTSVREAVDQGMRRLSGELVFGRDVQVGIPGLASDAGPPEKVLQYLERLAEMVEARRTSPSLGQTAIMWLRDKGVNASRESETVRNSEEEMAKRTWHDGNGRRRFEMHLKPNDAVAPDRCVRIYFDYDEEQEKALIGWIGRHP